MRTLRSTLILLLCLALPAYGYAALGIVQPPCPMQMGEAAMSMADGAHDCCLDADTAAKTGHPCKSGQECKVGSLFQFATPQFAFLFTAASPALPALSLPPIANDPSGVWRPPRAL